MEKKKLLQLNKRQISKLTINNFIRGGGDTFADDTNPPTENNTCQNFTDECPPPTSDGKTYCGGTGGGPIGGGPKGVGGAQKLTTDCVQN